MSLNSRSLAEDKPTCAAGAGRWRTLVLKNEQGAPDVSPHQYEVMDKRVAGEMLGRFDLL